MEIHGPCSATLGNDPQKITGAKRKTIRFLSYDPGDYVPLFNGDWKINDHELRGIVYHKSKEGKQPLVVLMHGFSGVGGAANAYNDITKRLTKGGASVLIIKYRLSVDVPGRVVGTFEGIKEAVKLPWIDPEKIYMIGLSTGGMQAIHSIVKSIHNKLNDGSFTLAGVMGIYPSCRVKFEDSETIDTKVVLMTGAQDNQTSPQQCDEFIKEVGLKNVTRIHLEDVGHSWLFRKKEHVEPTELGWLRSARCNT